MTNEEKQLKSDMESNEFFSTYQLAEASWFKHKSVATIINLIKQGELEARNISASKSRPRYEITKESVIKYLVKLDEIINFNK